MVFRGKNGLVWLLGFITSVIYVAALTTVLQNLDQWINIFAYASGYATGNVVGIWVEGKLAVGHNQIRIISPMRGLAISERLREEGFVVTEFSGRGRDGVVTMVVASVMRKDSNKVRDIVKQVDENAFITAETLSPVRRGTWRVEK